MSSITNRTYRLLLSTPNLSRGVGIYALCAVGTALACAITLLPGAHQPEVNVPPATPGTTAPAVSMPLALRKTSHGVTFSGEITNPKIVQGDSGRVYLNFAVATPELSSAEGVRKPTDMLVILDKSGSMSAENRLPYAKSAIIDLLGRLNEQDRFALVTFDSGASTLSPFVEISATQRERLSSLVSTIQPGSGTNMSGGINLAESLLRTLDGSRSRRVILLSDGEANEGITSSEALGQLSRDLNRRDAVVSTIGMGLGFNERVMSLVADQGGGNFSYLESLATLGTILNKDLLDARQVFASSSEIRLQLPRGARLVDAGGYPIEGGQEDSGAVTIRTGQLLSGKDKRFFVTLDVPTSETGSLDLGKPELRLVANTIPIQLNLGEQPLKVAVVQQSERVQANAALNQDLWRDAWSSNNYGVMQRELQSFIRSGDRVKADQTVARYQEEITKAEAASGVSLRTPELLKNLHQLAEENSDSFSGSTNEQELKRNRYGKKLWGSGASYQRGSY